MLGWEDPSWHSPVPIPFSGKRKRTFRSYSFRKPELKSQHLNYTLLYHEPVSWSIDLIEQSPDYLRSVSRTGRFLLWAWSCVWFQIPIYRKDTNMLDQVL